MSEYQVTLQNQPVDVSEEFSRQENHFFVGSKVEEFDRRGATGKIKWKSMSLKQRVSYHQVTLPLEDYKVWQDAPPGEYKDDQDLPFSISFITPKAVRLRLAARPETTRYEPFSLMLDGEPGTDDSSWEMSDSGSSTTYESRFGSITVTHDPWHLEFRDAQAAAALVVRPVDGPPDLLLGRRGPRRREEVAPVRDPLRCDPYRHRMVRSTSPLRLRVLQDAI